MIWFWSSPGKNAYMFHIFAFRKTICRWCSLHRLFLNAWLLSRTLHLPHGSTCNRVWLFGGGITPGLWWKLANLIFSSVMGRILLNRCRRGWWRGGDWRQGWNSRYRRLFWNFRGSCSWNNKSIMRDGRDINAKVCRNSPRSYWFWRGYAGWWNWDHELHFGKAFIIWEEGK